MRHDGALMKMFLLLILAGMCGCMQRQGDPNAWSPNSSRSGKPFFEGARMGWHRAALDDEPE